ncbi:MAG: transposase, partial [Deltaproteobacteria bacterium]|nr:transposase [Deltaproteobacteria bacterium]
HCNLAYRWFCHLALEDEVPDHSSLTRIRDRLGEETFKTLFEKIIDQCRRYGLVTGKRVMADASMFEANASLYSLVKIGEEDQQANSDSHHRKSKWILGEKISNKTNVSATDPDAKLAGKMGNRMILRYKDHRIVDADSRVILDTHVTDGAVMEGTIFLERLKTTREHLDIEAKEVIADRGYGYGENLKPLMDAGDYVYIPRFRRDVGEGLEGFTYDQEKDRFICQAGIELYPQNVGWHGSKKYRTPADVCKTCQFNTSCKSKTRGIGRRYRDINVSDFHVYQALIRARKRLIGAVGGNYLDFITHLIEMIVEQFFSEKIGNLAA